MFINIFKYSLIIQIIVDQSVVGGQSIKIFCYIEIGIANEFDVFDKFKSIC